MPGGFGNCLVSLALPTVALYQCGSRSTLGTQQLQKTGAKRVAKIRGVIRP
jgi:hypothetical protein